MDKTLGWITSLTFSDWGTITSFMGLGISIWLLKDIRSIKIFYEIRARIPELLDKLTSYASNLSELQNDFSNNGNQIRLEIGQCEIISNRIREKVGKRVEDRFNEVKDGIKEYKTSPTSQNLWEIYGAIQLMVLTVREIQDDLNWER